VGGLGLVALDSGAGLIGGGSEEVPGLLEFRGGGDQALPLKDVEVIIDAVWRVLQAVADRAGDGA